MVAKAATRRAEVRFPSTSQTVYSPVQREYLDQLGASIMQDKQRFDDAIARMDEANAADPRTDRIDGKSHPRELLFAQRVYRWLPKLVDDPTEALFLAARGHTLRRWEIPRDRYSMDNIGYHEWRDVLAAFHADQAAAILQDVGYDTPFIDRVRRLITRADFPDEHDARVLEDADCLVFLETKLHNYLDEWGQDKAVRILKKTLKKMTSKAQELAAKLELPPQSAELLRLAVS